MFWALNTFLPRRLWGFAAGLSNSCVPSAAEERTIRAVMEALFPIVPRKKGAVFDMVVSEPDVDTYPLENITVPTLIVHAADDTLARYEPVPRAASRIPGARLLTIERGGHLLLGAEDRVRAENAGFVRSMPRSWSPWIPHGDPDRGGPPFGPTAHKRRPPDGGRRRLPWRLVARR